MGATIYSPNFLEGFFSEAQGLRRAGAVSDLAYLISVHVRNLLRDRQPVGVVLDPPVVLNQSLFGHHLGCEAPFVYETL